MPIPKTCHLLATTHDGWLSNIGAKWWVYRAAPAVLCQHPKYTYRNTFLNIISLFDQLSIRKRPKNAGCIAMVLVSFILNKCVSNFPFKQLIAAPHILVFHPQTHSINWAWRDIFMSLDNPSILWNTVTWASHCELTLIQKKPVILPVLTGYFLLWAACNRREKNPISKCMHEPTHSPTTHTHTQQMPQTPLLLLLGVLIEYSSSLIKEP